MGAKNRLTAIEGAGKPMRNYDAWGAPESCGLRRVGTLRTTTLLGAVPLARSVWREMRGGEDFSRGMPAVKEALSMARGQAGGLFGMA